ncbi:hypothetical protein OROGR_016945 [Orobanche gracilis]
MRTAGDLCRISLRSVTWRNCRFFCTEQRSGVKIFDRNLKRKQVQSSIRRIFFFEFHVSFIFLIYGYCVQRDRAAWLMGRKDSLLDAVAENLLDRLEDCKRTFSTALCMGGSLDAIRRLLNGRELAFRWH